MQIDKAAGGFMKAYVNLLECLLVPPFTPLALSSSNLSPLQPLPKGLPMSLAALNDANNKKSIPSYYSDMNAPEYYNNNDFRDSQGTSLGTPSSLYSAPSDFVSEPRTSVPASFMIDAEGEQEYRLLMQKQQQLSKRSPPAKSAAKQRVRKSLASNQSIDISGSDANEKHFRHEGTASPSAGKMDSPVASKLPSPKYIQDTSLPPPKYVAMLDFSGTVQPMVAQTTQFDSPSPRVSSNSPSTLSPPTTAILPSPLASPSIQSPSLSNQAIAYRAPMQSASHNVSSPLTSIGFPGQIMPVFSGHLFKLGRNKRWQWRLFRFDGMLLTCLSTTKIKIPKEAGALATPLPGAPNFIPIPDSQPMPLINNSLLAETLDDGSPSATWAHLPKWTIDIGTVTSISLMKRTRKGREYTDIPLSGSAPKAAKRLTDKTDKTPEPPRSWFHNAKRCFVIRTSDGKNYVLRAKRKDDLERWLFVLVGMWRVVTAGVGPSYPNVTADSAMLKSGADMWTDTLGRVRRHVSFVPPPQEPRQAPDIERTPEQKRRSMLQVEEAALARLTPSKYARTSLTGASNPTMPGQYIPFVADDTGDDIETRSYLHDNDIRNSGAIITPIDISTPSSMPAPSMQIPTDDTRHTIMQQLDELARDLRNAEKNQENLRRLGVAMENGTQFGVLPFYPVRKDSLEAGERLAKAEAEQRRRREQRREKKRREAEAAAANVAEHVTDKQQGGNIEYPARSQSMHLAAKFKQHEQQQPQPLGERRPSQPTRQATDPLPEQQRPPQPIRNDTFPPRIESRNAPILRSAAAENKSSGQAGGETVQRVSTVVTFHPSPNSQRQVVVETSPIPAAIVPNSDLIGDASTSKALKNIQSTPVITWSAPPPPPTSPPPSLLQNQKTHQRIPSTVMRTAVAEAWRSSLASLIENDKGVRVSIAGDLTLDRWIEDRRRRVGAGEVKEVKGMQN